MRFARDLDAAPVYRRLAPPAGMVVNLDRAKAHLRLDGEDGEDELIHAAILSATQHLDGRDGMLGKALLTQTWTVTGAELATIDLAPVQAVLSIEIMVEGVYQALPAGSWRAIERIGKRTAVIPARGAVWPSVDADPEAWRITFRAGYGDRGADVPAPIRSAILLMVADLFDGRDGKTLASLVENPTIARLLDPYKRQTA